MAKRLKLGMISVRQRSTKGSASGFRKISQGRLRQRVQVSAKFTEPGLEDMEERQSASVNDDDSCDWDEDWTLGNSNPWEENYVNVGDKNKDIPNLYSVKEREKVSSWGRIRDVMRNTCVESFVLPDGSFCIICMEAVAKLWCRRCGARAYYCQDCWTKSHTSVNIFHTPELWEDDCFKPVEVPCKIDVLEHECLTKKEIAISCLDEDGIPHAVAFSTCECEPLVVTLARARLWPSTPKNPRHAFTFELLDWYEALLLECQVALKDFCQALAYKLPYLVVKNRDVYESLIDSFEEYRFMKNELKRLQFLCPGLDDRNTCPACPKESGTAIISLDALFGLPRKKHAGQSHRDPLNGNRYFLQQLDVDNYLTQLSKEPPPMECNDFLAGNSIRSATRYHGLDETAVFGASCRHEIPLMFINLKHGERLGYAVHMLKKLLLHYPESVKIILFYDVACTLQKYLKSHEAISPSSLSRLKLSIPAFHAYGHKVECQLNLSPLRCEGLGLSDGEVMERLWSFLRRYGKMTKEMRPSHRVDILSDALDYYAHKKKLKLHEMLYKRFVLAREKRNCAKKNLDLLCKEYKVSFDMLQQLSQESLKPHCPTPSKPPSTEYSYFLELKSYYELNDEGSDSLPADEKTVKIEIQKKRALERLVSIEAEHSIVRWERNSEIYLQYVQFDLISRQSEVKQQLHSASQKRHFLLKQKAKYADGQKIAKKLSKQITKVTTSIRNTLLQYNQQLRQATEPELTLKSVLDVNSSIWLPAEVVSVIPQNVKHDIIQSFFQLTRSEEEIDLIEYELGCIIHYYRDQMTVINSAIASLKTEDNNTPFRMGSIALLTKLRWSMELLLHKAESVTLEQHSEEVIYESSSTEESDCDD